MHWDRWFNFKRFDHSEDFEMIGNVEDLVFKILSTLWPSLIEVHLTDWELVWSSNCCGIKIPQKVRNPIGIQVLNPAWVVFGNGTIQEDVFEWDVILRLEFRLIMRNLISTFRYLDVIPFFKMRFNCHPIRLFCFQFNLVIWNFNSKWMTSMQLDRY